MILRYPYKNEIDLTPLVTDEVNKAREELGLRKDEDLTVMVEMGKDLHLVIRVGVTDKGAIQ
ncbi:MAG: hypothetical protein JSV69_03115 [Chloroflexota bacterium]|jgi:hypothetical protein|nr:MAG: hypothetical protein JSV69_03115 [Chloroflexota bacterium]UCF27371.1 MAG: hypothetical protein JSW42_12115 [Chloroflexota bacterium]